MAIRTYRPYTKSRRSMTNSTFEDITKSTPEKSLLGRVKKTGGRNNQGKITAARTTSPRPSRRSNTIPTATPTSRSSAMRMA